MDKKESKLNVILSSAVIVALITSIVSLVTNHNTNNRLKDIESQKYGYGLHQIRYEKLQESLTYFARFYVFDYKFIYRFDSNSEDYSVEIINDMLHDSIDEFLIQIRLLYPYISEEEFNYICNDILGDDYFMEGHMVHVDVFEGEDDKNERFKDYFRETNSKWGRAADKIALVVISEMRLFYIPQQY